MIDHEEYGRVERGRMVRSRNYTAGGGGGSVGHVFVELWTGYRWIVIDSTSGEYVRVYNRVFSVLQFTKKVEPTGYYVLLKGLDPADYGVSSNEQLQQYMREFAAEVDTIDMYFPEYEISWLPR